MPSNNTSFQPLVTFLNSQGDVARGTLLKIDRSTLVFEVYNPYSIVQLSEVLDQLTIRRGDRKIYEGRAVVSNLVNTGLMLIVSVTLVDSWKDLSGALKSQLAIRRESERFVSDWVSSNRVRTGYQLVVGEIQSFFSNLSRWLEQLDISDTDRMDNPRKKIGEESFQELIEPIAEQTQVLFSRFENEAADVSEGEIVPHKAYIQRCLHPLVMRAPFPYRAFVKPLGYAGDYETVNMMLNNPRVGPTTYAEVINSLFLKTGPAEAHRNRIELLNNILSSKACQAKNEQRILKVLNVGCGPAVELQKFIAESNYDNCIFRLVDFNKETLEYAKTEIERVINSRKLAVRMEYDHRSVHSLLKDAAMQGKEEHKEKYDLIYCAGLFDYFSDRVCGRLIKLFYKWLKPKVATIIVTNVHPSNNSMKMMEHLLEWYLVYRDEERMRGLARGIGKQRIFVDETGINVFLEITN